MEIPPVQSGDLHRDGGLPHPAAAQRVLLHHGAADSPPPPNHQPRREAQQDQDPPHDRRAPLYLLLLLHPLQREPGVLRTGPHKDFKRLLRGVGGANHLPHSALHRRLQLLLRSHRVLLHLRDHPELHKEEVPIQP